jgi:transposase, IS5 family
MRTRSGVAAPKQRNTEAEKGTVKEGKSAAEIWPDEPAKARQKDADARWTLKFATAKLTADGKPQVDIAIPSFGYKSSLSTSEPLLHPQAQGHRCCSLPRSDGPRCGDERQHRLRRMGRYRLSQPATRKARAAEQVSRIHRSKPRGGPIPEVTAMANAVKS